MLNINKRTLVRGVARFTVHSVALQATTAIANQVFDPEPDTAKEQYVETGSEIAGHMIGIGLWSRTDALVDRVADWRVNRKEMKAANAA